MSDYTQYLQGKAIRTGCEWVLKIKVTAADLESFVPAARFVSQFRAHDANGPVLAELTTENGKIVRVDGQTLELYLKQADTEHWTVDTVIADIVRVDLAQRQHLGFDLIIPVRRTVTRV